MPAVLPRNVRDARRLLAEAEPRAVPLGTARSQAFASTMATRSATFKGKPSRIFEGHANTYEQGYEMYDFWGPYTEVISEGAGTTSLAAGPDVVFLTNHRGLAMARTLNGSLELEETPHGLHDLAYTNPERSDVRDLAAAIDDGVVTEQSFAFWIVRGQWSPDYTEYRILEYDINRGDVSGVNFGANPTTDIAARAGEIMTMLDYFPPAAAREAIRRLSARVELDPAVADLDDPAVRGALGRELALANAQQTAGGRSISFVSQLLDLDS